MKIAQVCPRYYPDIGGVETYVQEISERLVKRGIEVEVICTDPTGKLPEHDRINNVTITRFKSFAPGDAYYFAPQIYFYLKNHIYDLIHAHSYHAFPAIFAAFAKNKCRFVFTPYYHGGGHTPIRNLLHKPYKAIGINIFKKSDKVTCISDYELKKVITDFNIPEEKVEMIPVGLNLESYRTFKHNKKQSNEKILLYVGRLEEYKGIQHIIKTLPHLPDFTLEIIGRGSYENDLHKLGEKLSIAKKINWHKNITREELLQQYASADVLLALSTHESYGITVAEALASGTPCIVTKSGALSEFVDEKLCLGISLPIETDELIQTIKHAITIKQTKYDGNLLDWEEVVYRLIEVYEGIEK